MKKKHISLSISTLNLISLHNQRELKVTISKCSFVIADYFTFFLSVTLLFAGTFVIQVCTLFLHELNSINITAQKLKHKRRIFIPVQHRFTALTRSLFTLKRQSHSRSYSGKRERGTAWYLNALTVI